jgi:lipoyl(octanoyl) transferase
MSTFQSPRDVRDASLEAHLLGPIEFETCLALQQRLVYETAERDDGQITLLVCEHPPLVTIGRQGSRAHIRLGEKELVHRRLELRWVNRGGGCVLHGPGQLAIYPIVPLAARELTVGGFLDRLQAGVSAALVEMGVPVRARDDRHGVWARAGQVAVFGAAVKHWVSYHGLFVNVHALPSVNRLIVADPAEGSPMSSLGAERQRPLRITTAREALVRHLAASLGADRVHLHTGHPWLSRPATPAREVVRRVG